MNLQAAPHKGLHLCGLLCKSKFNLHNFLKAEQKQWLAVFHASRATEGLQNHLFTQFFLH